jgi:hypothetical protein
MAVPAGWVLAEIAWLIRAALLTAKMGFAIALTDTALLGMALVVMLTVVLVGLDVPLRLRFEASRASLDALAEQLTAEDAPDRIPDMAVGLFDAEKIERVPGGFRFLVNDTGFLDSGGFAYSPIGAPPNFGSDSYERFRGPWWIWIERFD